MHDDLPTIDLDASHLVTVPHESLNEETLKNIVREFIVREAANDASLPDCSESSIQRAIGAIKSGKYVITFDQKLESVGIIAADKLKDMGL